MLPPPSILHIFCYFIETISCTFLSAKPGILTVVLVLNCAEHLCQLKLMGAPCVQYL